MRIKRHDQASCAQVFGLLGLWVGKLNHSGGRRAAAYQILIKKSYQKIHAQTMMPVAQLQSHSQRTDQSAEKSVTRRSDLRRDFTDPSRKCKSDRIGSSRRQEAS